MTAESRPDVSLDDQCPRCGERFDPFQEYCLECGGRLPGSYTHGRPVRGSSSRWLWATVIALLLVALVAGAIVAVAATDNGGEGTGGSKAAGGGRGAALLGANRVAVPATTGLRTTKAARTKASRAAPVTWPAAKSGYTVVLLSVETSAGREGADKAPRNAIRAGLPDVGVLDSADFSSMRSGYYVVFSGVYDTIQEANSALGVARSSGYELAYPREITPKTS
jgi:hypothetical protein